MVLSTLTLIFSYVYIKILDIKTTSLQKQRHNELKKSMIDKLTILGIFNKNNAGESLEKLEVLIRAYAKDAEELKYKFPVFPSMLAALIVAEFNALLNYLIKYDFLKVFSIGISFFILSFIIILLVFGIYLLIRPLYIDLVNSKRDKVKNLCKYLENLSNDLRLKQSYLN